MQLIVMLTTKTEINILVARNVHTQGLPTFPCPPQDSDELSDREILAKLWSRLTTPIMALQALQPLRLPECKLVYRHGPVSSEKA